MNQPNQDAAIETSGQISQQITSLPYEDKEAIKKTILKIAENSRHFDFHTTAKELIACFKVIDSD